MTEAGDAAAPGPTASRRSGGSDRRLLEAGWLGAAVVVPLAINPWGHDPFVPLKVALLRTFVWSLVVVWLIAQLRASGIDRIRWSSPIAVPAAALAAAFIGATALAVDPGLALWGSAERSQGLLTLLSYLALGSLVAANLSSAGEARKLLAVIVLSSIPLVAVGAAQAAGFHGGLVTDARSPVHATLGRSNFLGAYLAMVIPPTMAWIVVASRRRWRIAASILALLETATVIATSSRAAWIATAVGAAVLLAAIHAHRLRRAWQSISIRAGLGTGFVVAAAGGIAVARADGAGEARLAMWQACLRLFFDRPLLGYGPDNLSIVFARVYPADLVYHQGRWGLVDRAHSWPIDMLMVAGLAGLAAFVAVLVAALVPAWRVLSKNAVPGPREALLAGAVAGIIAGLTVHLLGFEVTSTATVWWLLLGVAAASNRWTSTEDSASTPQNAETRSIRALGVVAVVMIGLIIVFNGRPVIADMNILRAERAAERGDFSSALGAVEKAIAVWPREPNWHAYRARLLANRSAVEGFEDPALLRRADASFDAALQQRPRRFDLWFERAVVATTAVRAGDSDAAEVAERSFRTAAVLAPQHAVILHEWARLDQVTGRLPTAEEKLRAAVDLDASSPGAWTDLAEIQIQRGRLDEAGISLDRALSLDRRWLPAWFASAVLHHRLGQIDAARSALAEARAIDPEHPELGRLEALVKPSVQRNEPHGLAN